MSIILGNKLESTVTEFIIHSLQDNVAKWGEVVKFVPASFVVCLIMLIVKLLK